MPRYELMNRLYVASKFAVDNPWTSMALAWVIPWLLMLVVGREVVRLFGRFVQGRTRPSETAASFAGPAIIGSALASYFSVALLFLGLYFFFEYYGASGVVSFNPWHFSGDLLEIIQFPFLVGSFAILGLNMDVARAHGKTGLRNWQPWVVQILQVGLYLLVGYFTAEMPVRGENIVVGQGLVGLALGLVVATFIIFALSTAIKGTDDIPFLVPGLIVQCGLAFVAVKLMALKYEYPRDDIPLLWAALAGAFLGFLCDRRRASSGALGSAISLACGAALGGGAISSGTITLLPFMASIFCIEWLSAMVQAGFFKFTQFSRGQGVSILRGPSLRHHLQLVGWSNTRILLVFWVANLMTTAFGLFLWSRGYLLRFR